MTFLDRLKGLYTSMPPEVTVTSSGALHVDPDKLLATKDVQKQLDVLRDLHIEPATPRKPQQRR
jgi:hypothetical protein